jgi:hypothetical protein
MSTSRIRRFVLAAALAVMPMQGAASVLLVLLCHGEEQAHALHAQHGGYGEDHPAGHQHDHAPADRHDNGTTSTGPYHSCCNLSVAAPPIVVVPPATLPEFPVRTFVPDTLHDLFFPDQPQRPPLA